MKKQRLRELLREYTRAATDEAIAKHQSSSTFNVLTIRFENASVDIPYQPWHPRTSVSLPGRWEREDSDAIQP